MKIKLFTILLLFNSTWAFSQYPIYFGQSAESVSRVIQMQVEGYYNASGYHSVEMNWDNKYYNGKISEVQLCKDNVYMITAGIIVNFCSSYVMKDGLLAKIITQYDNLSVDELEKATLKLNTKISKYYFDEKYENYTIIYLSSNGLATEEYKPVILKDFPAEIQLKIKTLQAEYLQKIELQKEEEKKNEDIIKNSEEISQPKAPEIFDRAEVMPTFPGGTTQLMKFIASNIEYPKEAKKQSIEGKVIAKFVVNSDGSISDIVILKSLGYGCDEEVVRVIKLMPKWKPGSQRGVSTNVYYTVPVYFKLN